MFRGLLWVAQYETQFGHLIQAPSALNQFWNLRLDPCFVYFPPFQLWTHIIQFNSLAWCSSSSLLKQTAGLIFFMHLYKIIYVTYFFWGATYMFGNRSSGFSEQVPSRQNRILFPSVVSKGSFSNSHQTRWCRSSRTKPHPLGDVEFGDPPLIYFSQQMKKFTFFLCFTGCLCSDLLKKVRFGSLWLQLNQNWAQGNQVRIEPNMTHFNVKVGPTAWGESWHPTPFDPTKTWHSASAATGSMQHPAANLWTSFLQNSFLLGGSG